MFDCFINIYADTELADWLLYYYECRNSVSRGLTLGEIPYALAEINFEIMKSEAC